MIVMKRVYDPPAPSDGARYLVERLWPRGIKKTAPTAPRVADAEQDLEAAGKEIKKPRARVAR